MPEVKRIYCTSHATMHPQWNDQCELVQATITYQDQPTTIDVNWCQEHRSTSFAVERCLFATYVSPVRNCDIVPATVTYPTPTVTNTTTVGKN